MTAPHTPDTGQTAVTEQDLHAYVDGQLSSEERATVDHWLLTHPEEEQRVNRWAADRTLLRQAMAPEAAEAVPVALTPALISGRPRQFSLLQLAAAVTLALLGGGAAGWRLHHPPIGVEAVMRESATAEATFLHQAALTPAAQDIAGWASKALHYPVSPPDLRSAGYSLHGAGLVATAYGPGCALIYTKPGTEPLTVFLRPMHGFDATAPMRPMPKGHGTDGYVWADKGLGVAVRGAAAPDIIREMSTLVRQRLAHHS